jgi:hypothetical protein
MPTSEEMFADAESASERTDRLEALKSAFSKSIARRDTKRDGFITLKEAEQLGVNAGIQRGSSSGDSDQAAKLLAAAERFAALTKDMSGDDQAAVASELDALNAMKDRLAKDITVASPGNLHPYDLEAPAKILVPRFTPLRNEMPRQKGQGTAREFRRILGYSNTGMGGVANLTPFFSSENGSVLQNSGNPTFGQLSLVRGQKIAYAMDVKTVGYVELSLSDLVSWKSQFSNLGFEDSRQLSQMALLWAHLLGEERAMLYGRGSGSGYEGPVAAPAITSIASAASGTGSGFGTTEFVKVTSYTGQGESLPSTEATNAALTAGRPLLINLTSQPAGAVAYGVYISTTTNTETFQGFFVPGANGNPNQIQVNTFVGAGATVPTADGSANANGYDGFLSVLSDPTVSGYFARFDQTYNTAGSSIWTQGGANNIGDQPWQDAFQSLYTSVYADPEEVWLNAVNRRQLANFLRSASNTSAAYRIHLDEAGANGATVGAAVTGLVNQTSPTDRVVRLRVHPYMPTGASFIRSVTLPIPDSHIAETTVATNVQDYMSVDWTPIQFSYDASTYQLGTVVHYAPKWSGAIFGLQ